MAARWTGEGTVERRSPEAGSSDRGRFTSDRTGQDDLAPALGIGVGIAVSVLLWLVLALLRWAAWS